MLETISSVMAGRRRAVATPSSGDYFGPGRSIYLLPDGVKNAVIPLSARLARGEIVRHDGRLFAMPPDIGDCPRDGFAISGARRNDPVGQQHAAHRRRRAGDEETDVLPLRLGRDPAHGIGRG